MSVEIKTDIKGIPRFLFAPGADPEKLHLHVSEVGPGTRAHAPHEHEGQEIFWVLRSRGHRHLAGRVDQAQTEPDVQHATMQRHE